MISTKAIILEDVLEELFGYLPPMSWNPGGTEYPVVFASGDEKELNAYLAEREPAETYPLIWLLYPFAENHTKTKLEVNSITFILAVESDMIKRNDERLKQAYSKVLMPLFFNIQKAFKRANIFNTENEYDVYKYPLASINDQKEQSQTITTWDAMRVTTSFTVIDSCLRPIKI